MAPGIPANYCPPMNYITSPGLVAGTVLLAALAGCVTDGSDRRSGYRAQPVVQAQVAVASQDDYDYYPRYEVYYSRTRNEYVSRDGNGWVRRPEPSGITRDLLISTPSVRLDFHDAPEQHHATVVKTYPKNWQRPEAKHDDKQDKKDDKKDDRNDDRKDDNRRN